MTGPSGAPALSLTADQAATLRSALADAITYREHHAAEWCGDCERHPAGCCDDHDGDFDKALSYTWLGRDLAAAGLIGAPAALEPYCGACGAPCGLFQGYGGRWHHFRGEGTAAAPVVLYDAGHEPAVAWRPARDPGVTS